jgi:hypothetical protein
VTKASTQEFGTRESGVIAVITWQCSSKVFGTYHWEEFGGVWRQRLEKA